MKIKSAFVLSFISVLFLCGSAPAADESLVVHEWGTFTSFQSGDGKLLYWKPLQSSQLPQFVYDWKHPGLGLRAGNRMTKGGLILKGEIVSLQRMETPVVYFYSDKEMSMDVAVKFPGGFITEWFPQATMIGPSIPALLVPAPDGAAANTTGGTKESVIKWSKLELLPATANPDVHAALPAATSGSHYLAARETDADFVRSSGGTNPSAADYEKFLFYRGAGNFETPLRVTMKTDETLVVANTGKETLSHLFLLKVKDKDGCFVYLPELPAGREMKVDIDPRSQPHAGLGLSQRLGIQMSRALVKAGLYPREAEAMVNTWKDSWFAEDGVRVLYVLPGNWTDQTLPMTLNPAPKQLVRVMVGRAEVLPPRTEHSLAEQLNKANRGDAEASTQSRALLKGLGRFAEPAFYKALAEVKPQPQPQEQTKLMMLLVASQSP